MQLQNNIQLGLGLIGIGREWGTYNTSVPEEEYVINFLASAFNSGIRFFDTAPAYNKSEIRFGNFLKTLEQSKYNEIIVSTKFGEHWDNSKNGTFVDHSYDALCSSFDLSLKKLTKIDVIQLHKSTSTVLRSIDFVRAIEYARNINKDIIIGASVSDLESANIACSDLDIDIIQFPFNYNNKSFEELFSLSEKNNKWLLINRPFNMGGIFKSDENIESLMHSSYELILSKKFKGYVLTGTKSLDHLHQNQKIFTKAYT
jgi:aryl-alcohol dehydrogenase-like predicted oxidoreductase